jgi:basic amino acid/polyamine antiporter, APA family
MHKFLRTKPMSMLFQEAGEQGEHTLRRSLGALNLITLGIGAVIGAGIFVVTGQAAAKYAGPGIALSFVLAGFVSVLAGLCYAEFASIIPIAGSAYTYGYATLGEFVAWIIGWDLGLEYGLGSAAVASGWSGYFNGLLQQLHIYFPPQLTATPGTVLVFYHERWLPLSSLSAGVNTTGLRHATGLFNLLAILAILVVTAVLVIGIKESANLNSLIVAVKLSIVGIFLVLGGYFLMHHPELRRANWHPFIPPSDGKGHFGWNGVAAGAASVFFAYIGFDAVSTAAQEARNPQKDMPVGILGSLAICTILYIMVAVVLTGLVNYKLLNVAAPVALGIEATGSTWGELLVNVGAVFGLGTVMLVMLLGQSRVFFSMSRDGLLPGWASKIHPRTRTPWISTIAVGVVVAVMPALLPIDRLAQLVNIGTLLAFTIVCAGVWVLRVRHPDLHRPFKTPFVPLVPILGMISSVFLMTRLPRITWEVLLGWLVFGLTIYFGYSIRHSKVGKFGQSDGVN